jgi:hypothetical protein
MPTAYWSQNLDRNVHLEDPSVDERIILKSIVKRQAMEWINLTPSSQ